MTSSLTPILTLAIARYSQTRAADEIIDEGHFIGKALGEGMNGYRPIVELMNTNFGIYGMAELSSAGNTFATTGGKFDMPMTIIGAGGKIRDSMCYFINFLLYF